MNQSITDDVAVDWDNIDWDENEDWDENNCDMSTLDPKLASSNIVDKSVDAKKLRDKQQLEETVKLMSDNSGIESCNKKDSKDDEPLPLKTIKQFDMFGMTISKRLNDSTSMCVVAFMKSLCDKLPDNLNIDNYDAIITVLNKRLELKKEKGGTVANVVVKKSSKVLKMEQERHYEVFGSTEYDFSDPISDEYESFEDKYR